jgi:hypothetical protein
MTSKTKVKVKLSRFLTATPGLDSGHFAVEDCLDEIATIYLPETSHSGGINVTDNGICG